MNRYLQAGVITLAILALIFSTVWLLDDSRISVLNNDIDRLGVDSESNRILLFYTQVFSAKRNPDFCLVVNQSATIRSQEGDLFFSKLAEFENANLLGNYETLKRKYLLNRIELWLYTTLLSETCNTNISQVLYFYRNKPACDECQIQGDVLETVRSECPNVKIFAISTDEGVDLVPLIQAQFGVTKTPALVLDNNRVFESLASKETILEYLKCESTVTLENVNVGN